MKIIKKLSDGMLNLVAPKVEAEAVYYWVYYCRVNVRCADKSEEYRKKYCHDSGGGCSQDRFVACGCP